MAMLMMEKVKCQVSYAEIKGPGSLAMVVVGLKCNHDQLRWNWIFMRTSIKAMTFGCYY